MKVMNKLYGAILGDLAGQPYEFPAMKGTYDNLDLHSPLSIITDDTIMTLASALYLVENKQESLEYYYKFMGGRYPEAGYGDRFKEWLKTSLGTKNYSYGNGCLMRLSPFMYDKEDYVLCIESCMGSHRHQQSIEAVVRLYNLYNHELPKTSGSVVPFTKFKVQAEDTIKFIEDVFMYSTRWTTHEIIRKVIECGGDTDTNASIIGELSNFYRNDITQKDIQYIHSKLDDYQLNILKEFNEKYK